MPTPPFERPLQRGALAAGLDSDLRAAAASAPAHLLDGHPGFAYTYSRWKQQIGPAWIPAFGFCGALLTRFAGCAFNSVLINLYRTGTTGWAGHADENLNLDPQRAIASFEPGGNPQFSLQTQRPSPGQP